MRGIRPGSDAVREPHGGDGTEPDGARARNLRYAAN
jgi:hypothetical protein